MSPGMSQKGNRRSSRRPVRAGMRGKKELVPATAQISPSLQALVWADCMVMPAPMKARPVPTEPVRLSAPNPRRTPADSDP